MTCGPQAAWFGRQSHLVTVRLNPTCGIAIGNVKCRTQAFGLLKQEMSGWKCRVTESWKSGGRKQNTKPVKRECEDVSMCTQLSDHIQVDTELPKTVEYSIFQALCFAYFEILSKVVKSCFAKYVELGTVLVLLLMFTNCLIVPFLQQQDSSVPRHTLFHMASLTTIFKDMR